jgi:hypothetical protein
MNDYGQRQPAQGTDELRGRMAMSPTGLQIVSDGSLAIAVYTTDPATAMLSPENGHTVIWDDTAGSGTVYLASFVRGIGWMKVVMT